MLEDIKLITEEVFGIENIAKRKRKEDYPRARAVFYAIARKLDPNLPLAKIGKFMGGRDHATVVYALKMIEVYKLEYRFERQLSEVRKRSDKEIIMIFDDDIIDKQSKMIEKLKEINSELRSKIGSVESQEFETLIKYFSAMNEVQRYECLEYRVKPFAKLNKIEI